MKPKHGALIIALILTVVVTLLFVELPSSANLTVAYVFCLIGIALLESGFLLATARNVPVSYTLIRQTGRFLPLSLFVSIIVLMLEHTGFYTLPIIWHVICQIMFLALSTVRLVKVFAGGAYIEKVSDQVKEKTTAWHKLIQQANALAACQTDADVKQAVRKVAEALQYADPRGTNSSVPIEKQIAALLETWTKKTVCEKDCQEVLLLISERNEIVKTTK